MRSRSVAEHQLVLQKEKQVPERLSRPGLLPLGSDFGLSLLPGPDGLASLLPHTVQQGSYFTCLVFSPQ